MAKTDFMQLYEELSNINSTNQKITSQEANKIINNIIDSTVGLSESILTEGFKDSIKRILKAGLIAIIGGIVGFAISPAAGVSALFASIVSSLGVDTAKQATSEIVEWVDAAKEDNLKDQEKAEDKLKALFGEEEAQLILDKIKQAYDKEVDLNNLAAA